MNEGQFFNVATVNSNQLHHASNEPLLVAILNNKLDFEVARDKHWYRIPISSQRKWLARRWPPKWIAFYQTKVFGSEKYSIRYFARVQGIKRAFGYQLVPSRGQHTTKGQKLYYQLLLGKLQQLPMPIRSLKLRRVTFIPTTFRKFIEADEINDLFDDSPLENLLWDAMKDAGIPAERQFHEKANNRNYILDFAIECVKGKIDVETDGDRYHANPEKAVDDNLRNNALEANGWKVLRFSTVQVREEATTYCMDIIADTIDSLGGLDEGGALPRLMNRPRDSTPYQPSLFD